MAPFLFRFDILYSIFFLFQDLFRLKGRKNSIYFLYFRLVYGGVVKFNQHSLIAFILIALLMGLLFLVSNWSTIFNEESPSVTIAVSKTPLSTPLYVADEKGFFDPRCAKVKLKEVIGGNRSFDSMISGEADFATSSDSVIVFRGLVRSDFSNIASFVQSDNDVKFIALESSAISFSQDFKNKKIGVTKGAAGEYFLSTFLALGGLSVEDVNLVHLSPEQMQDALQEGLVDVIVPWEPYAHNTIKAFKGKAKIIPSKNLYTLSFNLLVNKSSSNANSETAACVLKGLKKSIDFIAANKEETQNIIVKKLNLDPSFIDWVWQDYIFKLDLSRSLLMNLESQANWAIKAQLVKARQPPDFRNYLESEPLTKVDPLAVNL